MPATLNAVMWVLSVSRKRFDALGVQFEKPCNWILIGAGTAREIVGLVGWTVLRCGSCSEMPGMPWDWFPLYAIGMGGDTGSEKLTHPTIYFIVCMRSEQLKRRVTTGTKHRTEQVQTCTDILKMGLLDIMSHEACRHGNFGRQGHQMDRCAQADLERPDFKCFPKLKAQSKQADNQHVPVAKCRMSGQSRRSSVLVTC